MKLELTDSFQADRRRLSADERRIVAGALPGFVEACDRYASDPSAGWPSSLRVRDVEGPPGILEGTFSLAGPEIRATFEWIRIDSGLAIRWRRIGGHRIFRQP